MPPFMMGYHGPKPGTIWYTVQAVFMSTLFGVGTVVIAFIAMLHGDPLCLSGAVVCAIFCTLFIIGYFVDTKGLHMNAKEDYPGMYEAPHFRQAVALGQEPTPTELPTNEESQPLGSNKDELIR
jgi:hypothetical protein